MRRQLKCVAAQLTSSHGWGLGAGYCNVVMMRTTCVSELTPARANCTHSARLVAGSWTLGVPSSERARSSPGSPRYDVIRQKHRIVIRYAVITPVTVITGTVTRNLRKSCLDRLTCRCYTRTQELPSCPQLVVCVREELARSEKRGGMYDYET